MAITDYDDYKDTKLPRGKRHFFVKSTITQSTATFGSLWAQATDGGSAPGSSAACNEDTVGALFRPGTASGQWLIAQARIQSNFCPCVVLCDRLVETSGMDGTVTSEQTTQLPHPALPRYTSGEGVMAAVVIWTQIGTNAGTTVTLNYTNSGNTSGRTTKARNIGQGTGSTGFSTAGKFLICPVQDTDLGVKSVQGLTLSGSTGTAGNIGIVLFRPLLMLANIYPQAGMMGKFDAVLSGGMRLAKMENAACPFLLQFTADPAGSVNGEIILIDA